MLTHFHQNTSSLIFSAAISTFDSLPTGTLVWATIGGFLVFAGLIFEKLAELLNDRFGGGWHPHKKLENFGWIILMIGIFIEIADAGFTANDVWQARQLADPRNANISEATATVVFFVSGNDFKPLTNWDARWIARMTPCESNLDLAETHGLATSFIFDTLDSESFVKDEGILIVGRSMDVGTPVGMRFKSYNFRSLRGWKTSAREIDNVNLLRIDINFLPHETEILGGSADLVFNNNLQKHFVLYPQSDTNLLHGTVGHPYMMVATNFDEKFYDDYRRATNTPILFHY